MDKKFPKGLSEHRFKQNPIEKKFAQAWLEQNKHGDNLAYLLDTRQDRLGHPVRPSDRDYVVAATVIQWLGSPVGQSFLQDLGYSVEAKSAKKSRRKRCEAQTPICSNELVRRYSVNGSGKKGETFLLCGACKAYLGRTITFKAVK